VCGRITLTVEPGELARAFAIDEIPDWVRGLVPRWNIGPSLPLVAVRHDPEQDRSVFARLRWGLVPFWARDPNIGLKMINARSETAADKPAFRRAFARRRCLLPVDGFFEWRREGQHKQPYWFHGADGRPLALAGLWERWPPHGAEGDEGAVAGRRPDEGAAGNDPGTGDVLETCTILTTGANTVMAPIHDRMPVILPPGARDAWLTAPAGKTAALRQLLVPYPADRLAVHAVTRRANRATFDEPAAIAPDPGAAAATESRDKGQDARGAKDSPDEGARGRRRGARRDRSDRSDRSDDDQLDLFPDAREEDT
jgi:putative SOS response-associated peptidase YedK